MQFIALTSIGIEHLLAEELEQAGVTLGKQSVGSVRFETDNSTAQRICMMTRFATRIMLLIDESEEITNKDALYKFARFQAWQDWFGPTQTFAIEFNGTNTELKNTQFSGLVIKDGVVDYFNDLYEQRPNVDKSEPNIRIIAKLNRDKCALYIDYSGPRLSDRGYRTKQGKAPIREHLAAALVKRSGWLDDITQPLFDPCCGSGTLLIEAAGMANNAPTNTEREFAFKRLPSFRKAKFDMVKAELKEQQQDNNLWLIGSDIDRKLAEVAEQNAERAGVGSTIKFKQGDANQLKSIAKRPGVVISNLPYGERIGSMAELVSLHRNMGVAFKKYFPNWKLALLGTDDSLFKLLKLSREKRYKFKNGPLDAEFNLYELNERQVNQNERATGLNYEGSSAFANRLKKNKHALKSWVKKEQINAYRVYDADIPEYNVAVDIYNDCAVIFEYAAPKEIEDDVAQKRLQDVITLTAQQLEIDPENIAVKVRKRQKGESQYTSMDKQNRFETIEEFGAKFKVNLFDYLDTGLFLDHRLARRYIQENANSKRVLNLFAYTGSVSVHAALGGAKAVTTVDMSKTYLKWAEENFALNELKNTRFRFEQADCLKWLEHAQGQYDLIFLDPPTFSNSKRMKEAFDVQRDHIQLLTWIKRILSPNGTLFFSNNKRGFKIDEVALIGLGLKAENISDKTLSPDFKRNKQIHNSWLITHG
ncbi:MULTISPECIES: bifunctional 23S rRNA (guanine(2069)-N(7))-methyltransferase RlmK/23S rRNA (guanine(2445)-N(2))-methyltransferase RlmL [unclassified Pseudoalteromonas]|uniref:bifunctional 23S rRNA (guanine(2069)-N(7))-methyltransferase RlmK/23S rRNA (guanine(2445)-N(2))-methyltransferase RlmL n=1 Tax=unclassified Pseudoalteromonas TaxID=194690 RepID=UPI001B39E3EB|nr:MULTISPECIES: bifunctional 23S rRNA (guanine(2069)-N(7))-methyltransferase RlmK/23S rRNA (guanine(2445)-N(2))-methyltransferase RlmL [unclassified Pseudoalteromonas]MBQ4845579.1 bifunctional 23S rRNA (guanine(2069)-N(7))-methyltransferase RlmK/23S rRNA (guanine(2445)-N(2))-methyltransferase RlmL [Pseudoalteromonas sp. MMG005]MBQ4848905.1 bifunctional 23S rRNA (guanine(2069)-N(7))-methyltransferase RlmK/23S rRNA (guanine(2445)-N(2))-methyltransferase RlmL [Pseudoalteromonas sp. MMG012]